MQLNVLYAPIVTLPNELIEPKINEQVDVNCDVNSNPKPSSISWFKIMNGNKKELSMFKIV